MKRKTVIILCLFMIFLCSCNKNTEQRIYESKNDSIEEINKNDYIYNNNEETNINYSNNEFLENILTAPEHNETDSEEKNKTHNDSLNFNDLITNKEDPKKESKENNSEIKKESIKEEIVEKEPSKENSKNQDSYNKKNNEKEDKTENEVEDKGNNKDKESLEEKINSFISPDKYDFSNLDNNQSFINIKNEISKLNNSSIIKIESSLLYSNSKGPNIEIYKTNDYYAIYLYCILNETDKGDSIENIKMNKIVLKYFLSTISSTPNELFDIIYNDYEINSTLSEKEYTKVGDAKIKAELMQKYVIYYIKSK